MQRDRTESLVTLGVLVGVLALLASFSFFQSGKVAGNYLVGVALTIAIYAIFSLGLSLEMGHTGLPNFGHVAFMGIGAYTVAILTYKAGGRIAPALEGWSMWGGLVAILVVLVAALLVYVPILMLAQRRRAWSPRTRLLVAAVPAALAGIAAGARTFPMSEHAAQNAVVFLGILLGVSLAALAGLILGVAGLRLREDYLAIVTLGAAEILRRFALNEEWLTEGSQGIQRLHRPVTDWARETQWWRDLARSMDLLPAQLANLAVAILVVIMAYFLLHALARSPWGRVLRAIREDEEATAALGKNVLLYKLESLMIGSALAAAAGILFIWNLASVVPEHFLSVITFYAVAILVLGGMGNHRGAILGAILIWGVFEFAGNLSNLPWFRARDIVFAGPPQQIFVGLVIILVVMFRPQGAIGNKEELSYGK